MKTAQERTATREPDRSPPRVVIEGVTPQVDGGRFPVKRVRGESVDVTARIFTEGHDRLAAVLRHRVAGEASWQETPLEARGNDVFEASFPVSHLGVYEYGIEAWVDRFETWRDGLAKKHAAGQPVASELLEGAELVRRASERAARTSGADADWLAAQAGRLGGSEPISARTEAALDASIRDTMARHPDRGDAARHEPILSVRVERERARTGAWYELFPRSCSPEPGRHGTLRDCEERLPYVAEMGFDVLYLPPIHPIGFTHRKGPNNTPEAGPDDPGSPWAIGAPEGGHKAVHPALGSLADFDRLVTRARELGLEIALDLAFQCSPDHPYVEKHPEWFRHRPDGSIQYAENPPKKYQDIYPLDFECEDWRALWEELRSVVLFWVERGVLIFRVDNPHTKPFAFWEWLIAEARAAHPEVVFLSEAFTRPSVMQYLAKAGFSQSYTYFTWRNTKTELEEYLRELTHPPISEFLRGNLFVNTPDILHEYLQTDRRAAFQVRVALAATLANSYGVYGPPFELCVGDALPGTEEYRDSEKYQVRHWDLDHPWSLRRFIARLNEIRRENPPLIAGAGPVFHPVDNPAIVAYSRTQPESGDTVLAVVNLDPHHPQTGWLELPLAELGLDAERPFQVHDLLGGARYLWSGPRNFVSLDPDAAPAHVFRLRRRVRTERDFDYFL